MKYLGKITGPEDLVTKEYTDKTSLPTVTSADNGKILGVSNGIWTAITIPDANGVSF